MAEVNGEDERGECGGDEAVPDRDGDGLGGSGGLGGGGSLVGGVRTVTSVNKKFV